MVGTRAMSPELPDPKALFLSTKPVGFKLEASDSLRRLVKAQVTPTPKVSGSDSGVEPENLHF